MINSSWRNYKNLKVSTDSTGYYNKIFICGGDDESGNPIILGFEDYTESTAQQNVTAGSGVFGTITRDSTLVESDYKTAESGSTATSILITGHGQQIGDMVWNYTRNEKRQILTVPGLDEFTVDAFTGMSAQSSKTAEAVTTATNVKITGHSLSVNDMIYNSTRDAYRFVLKVVDPDNVTVLSVTSQTNGDTIEIGGDIIAFFDQANDVLSGLYKRQSIDPSVLTFETPEMFRPLTLLRVDIAAIGQGATQYYLVEDVTITDLGKGLSDCWYAIKASKSNYTEFTSQRKLNYTDYWRDK
jgi:hypothetical protein